MAAARPAEGAESGDVVTICLPPLSEDDPLFSAKKRLAYARNLNFKFQIAVTSSPKELLERLDQIVQAARVFHLDEIELYFAGDDEFGPFSPRNELECLNSILTTINSMFPSANPARTEVLQVLQNAIFAMLNSLGPWNMDEMTIENFNTDAEELLLEWGKEHGVRTKLKIDHFKGAGRGAVAIEDMDIGVAALEIPESLIICEDLVHESDMFDILRKLDGITAETMLLLWSMRERYNSNSKFKLYFETLPEKFNTGLDFGLEALTALEGTLLFDELMQAREHLRQQYDALCAALCANYPNIFQPELYSWDQYLWACELWYSNGMKVVSSDGKLRTCLVPIAGLLNHSICPHILRYGKVDSESKSLKFHVSRPCKGGEQCFLSYGSLPGSHLVTFYGFLPKGNNPYDIIPLDFDDSHSEDELSQSQIMLSARTSHMMRGTWLSNSNIPHTYGLPPPLLAHLRAVVKGGNIEVPPVISGQDVDEETERAVLETILSIFNPMMEGLTDSDDFDRENSSWDVKLALDYKDLQRKIISSIIAACTSGLRELNGP